MSSGDRIRHVTCTRISRELTDIKLVAVLFACNRKFGQEFRCSSKREKSEDIGIPQTVLRI